MGNELVDSIDGIFNTASEYLRTYTKTEISAMKQAMLLALTSSLMEIGTLSVQFPDLVTELIIRPIEILASEPAIEANEIHRNEGNSEAWLARAISVSILKYIQNKLDYAALIN